jgi:hypothetical protein
MPFYKIYKTIDVEKIMFDEIFCNDMVDRCKLFFKKAVLPELVGKLYSRPLQEHTAKQNHHVITIIHGFSFKPY